MPAGLYRAANLRQIEQQYADLALMQRAGAAAAQFARRLLGTQQPAATQPILVLAGPGNNGGDALEAARLLLEAGFLVSIVLCGEADRLPPDAAAAAARLQAAGGHWQAQLPEGQRWQLIIDGLFGIGLSRAPEGFPATLITAANQLAAALNCPLLALDTPSGLNADTGAAAGPCIRASHTLAFMADKPGYHTGDGPDYCGHLSIATLDLPDDTSAPDGWCISPSDFADALRPRHRNSHKGSHGNALCLGGAPSMLGAALLAGRAALHLGSGRVYLGLLDPQAPPLDPQQAELMLRPASQLLDPASAIQASAIACGPGLGVSREARHWLGQALDRPCPLVLDADALNLIAAGPSLAERVRGRSAPTLLTPHPAEAARLLNCTVQAVQADRIAAATTLARQFRAGVILKGCGSVVALINGRWAINTTGNPALASAGTGDVLTGLLVALLAQGWPADQALLAAPHLHGAAADQLVAEGLGPIGLTASELIPACRRLFNQWICAAGHPPDCGQPERLTTIPTF